MMKRITKLFTILAVALMVCVPWRALAQNALMIDEYGALTDTQIAQCETQLQQVSDKYGVDVVALIASDNDGKDIVDFADDYFDYNGYGRGTDRSGIILVIDMYGREMYISTRGLCIDYFTDYGIESIADEIYPYLAGDFEGAVSRYAQLCDYYMNAAITDKPIDIYYNRLYIHLSGEDGKRINGHFSVYDVNGVHIGNIYVDHGEGYTDILTEDTNAVYTISCDDVSSKYAKPEDITVRGSAEYDITMTAARAPYDVMTGGAVSGGAGLIAALIGTGIMKSKNKSVRSKYDADRYVERGSFNLRDHRDYFLYSRTSRSARPKETERSSGGGGGHGGSFSGGSSTHTSSSGATHGGGGRRGF
jgi:uncharacterized membrane protein YgcG